MAKIKNVSGDDRLVPWLNSRLVLAGQVVEIPDEDAENYLCQPTIWAVPDATPVAVDSPAPTETAVA